MEFDISTVPVVKKPGTAGLDSFDRERDTRRSLLLDRVMNGRQRVSDSKLVQLPAEILADIVDRLADDRESLACLALTNSDCRQLARCSQFAEIHFDYSPKRIMMFLSLAQEGLSPETSDNGIGRCVRRVTFAAELYYVAQTNNELYASMLGPERDSYSKDEQERLHVQADDNYTQLRRYAIFAISTAMPNLEVLVWKDSTMGYRVDRYFLLLLVHCRAQHVKLEGVRIADVSFLDRPLPVNAWPLRSLDINVVPEGSSRGAESDTALSTFYTNIFQLCAPTLESLHWEMTISKTADISFGTNPIPFPRLRLLRLQLNNISMNASVLQSFLTAPLRHLELWNSPNVESESCQWMAALASCKPLVNLQSLVIPLLPTAKQPCVDAASFLAQHTHIKKLSIHERPEADGNTAHIDRCIIPVLANNRFDNLYSLCLAWGGGSLGDEPAVARISTRALAAIGTIVSLEQLCLSCGINTGWRCQWHIDHAQLRHHLGRLKKLTKLALCRDSYYKDPRVELEYYYESRSLNTDDYIVAGERPELDNDIENLHSTSDLIERQRVNDRLWEQAHRNRMLSHAEEYAVRFPSLEFIYCGQRQMKILRHPLSSRVLRIRAIPLTTERDEDYTLLEKTFGISTDE